MPEIGCIFFANEPEQKRFFTWLGWQVAAQHESNGKKSPDSRSLNNLFLRLALVIDPRHRRGRWNYATFGISSRSRKR